MNSSGRRCDTVVARWRIGAFRLINLTLHPDVASKGTSIQFLHFEPYHDTLALHTTLVLCDLLAVSSFDKKDVKNFGINLWKERFPPTTTKSISLPTSFFFIQPVSSFVDILYFGASFLHDDQHFSSSCRTVSFWIWSRSYGASLSVD